MTSSPSNSAQRALCLVAPVVPYAAVLVGLYALGNAWVAVIGYHLGIACVITAAGSWRRARDLLRGWSVRATLALVPVFLAAGVAIYLAWPVARLEQVDPATALAELGLDRGALWLFAWYSLINPWLEELYWRGFLYRETRRPAACDLLFGGYHVLVLLLLVEWPFAVLAGVALAAAGWVWRLLVRRYDGLLVPVLTHLAADVAIVTAVILPSTVG